MKKQVKKVYEKYKSDWEIEQERERAAAIAREDIGAVEFGYGVADLLQHVGIKYRYDKSFAKLASKVRVSTGDKNER